MSSLEPVPAPDAADPADIKLEKREPIGLHLRKDDARNEEARYDKENIYPNEPTRQSAGERVIKHNGSYGDGPKAIDIWTISEIFHSPAQPPLSDGIIPPTATVKDEWSVGYLTPHTSSGSTPRRAVRRWRPSLLASAARLRRVFGVRARVS
jgi:hypothetical protein